jgi:hypothetical protein
LNVEVKNTWSYTSTSSLVFITRYLISHKDKLAVTLHLIFPALIVSITVPENND